MKKGVKITIIVLVAVIVAAGAGIGCMKLFAPDTFDSIFSGKKTEDSAEAGSGQEQTAKPVETAEDTGKTASADDSAEEDEGPAADSVSEDDHGYSEMLAMYASSMTNSFSVDSIDLPRSEKELSFDLASEALTLCMGGSKMGQAGVFAESGIETILQAGYDKDNADPSHTCAFSVGKKQIYFYGEERTLLIVAIRGTSGGEWFSNFDFADSRTSSSDYAENFLQASQTINLKLVPILNEYPDALVLVCGHSRGAAAANLLGMTLDELYGPEGIYVYTFATPNTYKGTEKDGDEKYGNIFNFLNPADVVTELPLKSMGYHHIGTDIVLPGEPERLAAMAEAMDIFAGAAPSIEEYYTVRHSLTGAGESEDGFTTYEVMQALASSLTGIRSDVSRGKNMADIYEINEASPEGGNSDLAPLLDRLSKVIGRDGTYGTDIFMQHLPATYQALMDAYRMMAGGPSS